MKDYLEVSDIALGGKHMCSIKQVILKIVAFLPLSDNTLRSLSAVFSDFSRIAPYEMCILEHQIDLVSPS